MDHFRALHDGHHCWLSDLRPPTSSSWKNHGFVTPTDYLNHRFHHLGINLIAPCVMILALGYWLN